MNGFWFVVIVVGVFVVSGVWTYLDHRWMVKSGIAHAHARAQFGTVDPVSNSIFRALLEHELMEHMSHIMQARKAGRLTTSGLPPDPHLFRNHPPPGSRLEHMGLR